MPVFTRLVEFEIDVDTPDEAEAAWEADGPECASRVTAVHVFDEFGPTPNGFDPLWVQAINRVLEDRGSALRATDLDDRLWQRYLGPLIDAFEDGYTVESDATSEAAE
jgi:hypothetical protein